MVMSNQVSQKVHTFQNQLLSFENLWLFNSALEVLSEIRFFHNAAIINMTV